jgi:hypothetical protein
MQIERLRLVVEEAEAAGWCLRLLEGSEELSEPRLTLEQGVLVFEGNVRVPLAGLVPFRTEWTAAVEEDGRVCIRLATASVFGWRGGSGFLTGLIMERAGKRLAGRPGVETEGNQILLNPDLLLAGLPVAVRLRIRAIAVEAGRLVVETA